MLRAPGRGGLPPPGAAHALSGPARLGNGFQGGLQFTDSTWRRFGGRQYAPSADQASREEQIAVAKRVQQEQGWNAWLTCTDRLDIE